MQKSGFTLLELSIVLVIIGLIIGGITVGQEMIRQSQLQRIGKDAQTYQTAVNTFKLKYNKMLPGDMNNAFSYWGTNCAATNTDCNGNGDNLLNSGKERINFWQHLSQAGMITGTYVWDGNEPSQYVAGVNIPATGSTDSGFIIFRGGPYQSPSAHWLNAARVRTGITTSNVGDAIMTPAEAQALDAKLDNGDADSGQIFSGRGNDTSGATCTTGEPWTGTPDPTGDYRLDNAQRQCILMFRYIN